MQLISLPVSPYAARVRIALYAKALPVEIVPPPSDWRTSSRFRNVNPLGRVPILRFEDGSILQESSVIVEFLDDAFPATRRMLPAAPRDRARARMLARVADLYLMPPMVTLARPAASERERRRAAQELADGLAALDLLLGESGLAVGSDLSLADCALAPALFAARITGSRLETDLLHGLARLGAYAEAVAAEDPVARVLAEMEDGLRQLTEPAA